MKAKQKAEKILENGDNKLASEAIERVIPFYMNDNDGPIRETVKLSDGRILVIEKENRGGVGHRASAESDGDFSVLGVEMLLASILETGAAFYLDKENARQVMKISFDNVETEPELVEETRERMLYS